MSYYYNLIAAIFRQAINDIKDNASGKLLYDGRLIKYNAKETEQFIKSEWADFLLCGVEQDYIMDMIKCTVSDAQTKKQ